MAETKTIGLIGYGRIGKFLADQITEEPDMSLEFVYVRDSSTAKGVGSDILTEQGQLADQHVDLVVEAAHADLVKNIGYHVLKSSDLLLLSTTALADQHVEQRLINQSETANTQLYIPHGAVLGTDGLRDGRSSIENVSIVTRKNPKNIDFSRVDTKAEQIDGESQLYEGPTRKLCKQFPRNVNSHATIALAGLGFDRTNSTLIADASATDATHRIIAEGNRTKLEVVRSSSIEGVTGSYTLDSIWSSIQRVSTDSAGLTIV